MRSRLWAVVGLLAGLLCGAPVRAEEAGKVVFVTGKVELAQRPAQLDAVVHEGDELSTGADGYVYVKAVDNAFLILRPNSKARVTTYHVDANDPANTHIKLELLSGVARSISGQGAKKARQNFRFNTPVAAIGVRGTDFIVYTDQQTSRVAVVSGGVVVSGFGAACGPEGGGPCEGRSSHDLFASQSGMLLQVKRGENLPRLLRNSSLAPDASVAPRKDEPSGKSVGGGAKSNGATSAPGDPNAGAVSPGANGNANANANANPGAGTSANQVAGGTTAAQSGNANASPGGAQAPAASASPATNANASPATTANAAPVAGVSGSPVASASAGPVANTTASPVVSVAAGPVAGPTAGPVAGPTAGPAAAVTASPASSATAGPVASVTASPFVVVNTGPAAAVIASPTAAANVTAPAAGGLGAVASPAGGAMNVNPSSSALPPPVAPVSPATGLTEIAIEPQKAGSALPLKPVTVLLPAPAPLEAAAPAAPSAAPAAPAPSSTTPPSGAATTPALPSTPTIAAPAAPTAAAPATPIDKSPPEVLWGRWQAFTGITPDAVALAKLGNGTYAPALILGPYAIARFKDTAFVMPNDGQAAFTLTSSEALMQQSGKSVASASVENGRLTIDFASRSFSTGLTVVSGDVRVPVSATGDVSTLGVLSNGLTSGAMIRGYLGGAHAGEAGYLFQDSNTPGVSVWGATKWTR